MDSSRSAAVRSDARDAARKRHRLRHADGREHGGSVADHRLRRSPERAARTRWKSPTTDYLFAVEEVLKGFVAGSGIIVRQPGGIGVDGTATWIAGLRMLAEGDQVLLFLHAEEDGAHGIMEYGLGIFFEDRVGGRVFLLREPSLRGEVVLSNASAASARTRTRGYREAAAFRRWITDRVAGVERRSDYFAPELPGRPATVASPFRVLREGC